MKYALALLLCVFVILLSACGFMSRAVSVSQKTVVGSGVVVREERPLGSIHAVDVRGFGTLIITPGEQESLVIEAEDNLIPYLVSEVRGGCLYLRTRPLFSFQSSKPIRYHLTVRALDKMRVEGFAAVEAAGFDFNQLDARLDGYGQISLSGARIGQLDARLGGFSQLNAQGSADSQSLNLSGYAQVQAAGLVSRDAHVRMGGSSQAEIQVTDTLDARVDDSARLSYAGAPQVRQVVSPTGHIQPIQ